MLRRLQTLLRRGAPLLNRPLPVGRPPHQLYYFSKKNLPKGKESDNTGFKNFKRDQDKENEKEDLSGGKKNEEVSEKKEKEK